MDRRPTRYVRDTGYGASAADEEQSVVSLSIDDMSEDELRQHIDELRNSIERLKSSRRTDTKINLTRRFGESEAEAEGDDEFQDGGRGRVEVGRTRVAAGYTPARELNTQRTVDQQTVGKATSRRAELAAAGVATARRTDDVRVSTALPDSYTQQRDSHADTGAHQRDSVSTVKQPMLKELTSGDNVSYRRRQLPRLPHTQPDDRGIATGLPQGNATVTEGVAALPRGSDVTGGGRRTGLSQVQPTGRPRDYTQPDGVLQAIREETTTATTTSTTKKQGPTVKLDTYDGSTVLETFLARFETCASYYNWDERDRLFYLKTSLVGNAGQVLWEISPTATEADVVKLLRNRHGNVNQMERYRIELRNRKRKPGETLQSVYQDIRKLLALSYPGQGGELIELMGRDAFIQAITDQSLRTRIMDQQPKSLDDALAGASRMEVYTNSPQNETTVEEGDGGKRRVRAINSSTDSSCDSRIKKLEELVANQQREIRQLRSDATASKKETSELVGATPAPPVQWQQPPQPYVQPPQNPTAWAYQPCNGSSYVNNPQGGVGQPTQQFVNPPAAENSQGRSNNSKRQQRFVGRDECRSCGQKGHWQNECPARAAQSSGAAQNSNVGIVTNKWLHSETYMDITVGDIKTHCLIDSGCDQSVISLKMIPNAKLRKVDTKLFAANGSVISVAGAVKLRFKANDTELYADLLVSDDVDEFILGFDWLKRNKCQWSFESATLIINGTPIQLKHRPSKSFVRRIYARETVIVPPNMEVNVPVRMPLQSLRTPKCDWLTDTITLKPGLFIARTLLSDDDKFAALRFVNVSCTEHTVSRDLYLGDAVPGVCLSDRANGNFVSSHTISDERGNEHVDAAVSSSQRKGERIGEGVAGDDKVSGESRETVVDRPCSSPTHPGLNTPGTELGTTGDVSGVKLEQSKAKAYRPRAYPPGHVTDNNHLSSGIREFVQREVFDSCSDSFPDSNTEAIVKCAHSSESDLFVESSVSCSSIFRSSDCSASLSADCEVRGELEYLSPIINSLPADLTDEQKRMATNIILRNADVFSKHEYDLGRTNLLVHTIDTGDHKPFAQPLRSHPRVYLDTIDQAVDNLLKVGVIEPASSPWASNIVVVAKPGNPVPRITIDYRQLNSLCYKDKYPLKKISDCLDAMNGSVFFSTLDISSSFNQVPIDPKDRDKTAFITRRGQFRYVTMPMGGVNAASVFCRLMALVLKGLDFTTCLSYVDDTIVLGRTFEEHSNNLQQVLDRFRQANLKLRPKKCKIFQHRVSFVGHVVSAEGIATAPEKISCIQAWEFPRTMTELRGFLNLCGYYRSFCPHFATVAEPLIECLRKGVSLEHTERRQQAFDKLKELLTNSPVLATPNDDDIYVVDVDSSGVGAGAVLQQWQGGKLRVIEYASRTYNAPERRYCVTRLEMLALIFALRQWKQYLLGRHFIVRTDHMALTYYQQTKEPVGQQARYLDFVSQFDFDLQYRPGVRHNNADALSRLRPCEIEGGEPCKQCNRRIIGGHAGKVNAVRTRAQCRGERAEADNQWELDSSPGSPVGSSCSPAIALPVAEATPTAAIPGSSLSRGKGRVKQRRGKAKAQHAAAQAGGEDHHRSPAYTSQATVLPGAEAPPTAAIPGTGLPHGKGRVRQRRGKAMVQRTAAQAVSEGVQQWSPAYIAEQQAADPDIEPALSWIISNQRPSWDSVKPCSPALRSLWQQYESLVVRDGVLHRIFHNTDASVLYYQVVLPKSLKVSFLELIHADAAGHLKFVKCIPHVQRRAWWHTWRRDLKLFIQCCRICNAYHRGPLPKQGELHNMVIGGCGERWSIDLTGPHPMSNGYKYIFTAIDPFTKYAVAVPIRNKEASTVAKCIVEQIFLRWGLCTEILTDCGKEFEAQLTCELIKQLGILKLRTSGYKPSTNGAIESWHKVLNTLLAKVINENQRDWSEWLSYVVFCYNATPHSATSFAPHFLMTGQEPLWNIDFLLSNVQCSDRRPADYAEQMLQRIQRAHAITRDHLDKSASKTSNWYKKKIHNKKFSQKQHAP